jgi:hypothetical protein
MLPALYFPTHQARASRLRTLSRPDGLPYWQAEGDAYRLRLAAPGIDPANIDISVAGPCLTISVTTIPFETHGDAEGTSSMAASRYQFLIPRGANPAEVSAASEHGLLVISVPRLSSDVRHIAIAHAIESAASAEDHASDA